MKCIIVIRGLIWEDYLELRTDLRTQLLDRGVEFTDLPIFASLPQLPDERAEIEIVWLDEAMALEEYRIAIGKSHRQPVADTANDEISEAMRAFEIMRARQL